MNEDHNRWFDDHNRWFDDYNRRMVITTGDWWSMITTGDFMIPTGDFMIPIGERWFIFEMQTTLGAKYTRKRN
jgi:hypothetical protein